MAYFSESNFGQIFLKCRKHQVDISFYYGLFLKRAVIVSNSFSQGIPRTIKMLKLIELSGHTVVFRELVCGEAVIRVSSKNSCVKDYRLSRPEQSGLLADQGVCCNKCGKDHSNFVGNYY